MWLSGRYHPGQAPDNAREQPIPPRTAHNADHFATSSPLSAFFTEVVCDMGATPPQTSAAPPPIGGISLHELLTRRRHAARGLRVAKTPHRHRSGGCRREWRPGGSGRSTPRVTAITTPEKVAHNFRRSFFETAQKRCNSNEAISMFEKVARELRAKLVGERPVGPQAASRRRVCPLSARSAARGASSSVTPAGLPAQRPVSGRRAARPCHDLGYSPGAPHRPSRTRREWTRGRSTARRAPWPRSCRGP